MTQDFYCDQVIPGHVKVKKVFESESVLAFHHTNPFWEVHIVIVPKRHIGSFTQASASDWPVVNELLQVAQKICTDVEASQGGCRLSTNCGSYQSNQHLHFYAHAGNRLRNEDGSPIGHSN
jgi:histidine triad (HIT) family protein